VHRSADCDLRRQEVALHLLRRQKVGAINALRITAGTLRGRRIAVPPRDVRPTSERARQAFFNIVADRIAGAAFLDLFAGTGVFAFEAVSRGASSAVAVDASRSSVAAIQRFAKEWNANVKGVVSDVFTWLRTLPSDPCTVVYADPPYDFGRYDELLEALGTAPFAPNVLIAVEHRRNTDLASETNSLTRIRRAEYGEVRISMYARR
jgi:16S rRNA (guanine966-N2)-methyltransferase